MRYAGDMAGDEVVLLVLALLDPDEDVSGDDGLPLQSLRNFERISLQPNETTTVRMPLLTKHFQHALTDDEGNVFVCVGEDRQVCCCLLLWIRGLSTECIWSWRLATNGLAAARLAVSSSRLSSFAHVQDLCAGIWSAPEALDCERSIHKARCTAAAYNTAFQVWSRALVMRVIDGSFPSDSLCKQSTEPASLDMDVLVSWQSSESRPSRAWLVTLHTPQVAKWTTVLWMALISNHFTDHGVLIVSCMFKRSNTVRSCRSHGFPNHLCLAANAKILLGLHASGKATQVCHRLPAGLTVPENPMAQMWHGRDSSSMHASLE